MITERLIAPVAPVGRAVNASRHAGSSPAMLANLHNMNTDTHIEITPVIDNVTSLQDRLNGLADAQLKAEIAQLIQVEEILKRYSRTDWSFLPELSITGAGIKVKDAWPLAFIVAARDAMFEGLKIHNREKYISAFVNRLNTMENEIEEIRQQAGV